MDPSYTSKKRRTRSVKELTHTDKHLAGLLRQASGYQHLDRLLAPLLGPEVAAHTRVACLRDGELIILANSPVWANRVRMAAFRILARLKHFPDLKIRNIKVKVEPQNQLPAAALVRHPLSDSARKCLKQFADSCTDEGLSEIARNLSKYKGR